MNIMKRILLVVLVVSLLTSGWVVASATEGTAPATAPTEAPAETAAPTEAPAETAAPAQFTLAETVFPEADAATGTLKFYIKDQEVYAGGPVANLLAAGVTTHEDFSKLVQPWCMTSVQRVRVELEDVNEADKPFVFFVAMNASDAPKPVSECLIYSVTINTDNGILFGSGKEAAPFITGETTLEEILNAYGEPEYNKSANANYREIAYYEPFNCAYFSFNKDVVRQVTTYYSANVFGKLAENFTYDLGGEYFGSDAYILMNQYMDVAPYLPGATEEVKTGVLPALTESITLGEDELAMGTRVQDMPSYFAEQFVDQLMYVNKMYYLRGGRNTGEEFYFMNLDGQSKNKKSEFIANKLIIKGVFTENKNYVNWGKDNSIFLNFQYENLTHESTIDDVLKEYGMPYRLDCTSYGHACFAWMFYKDEAGNKLEICVDPILNQIVELRFFKYYEGEIRY